MRRLKTVFQFEFNELIKKKSMLISTLVVSLIFFGGTFAPRIIAMFDSKGSSSDHEVTEPDSVYDFGSVVVTSEDTALIEELKDIFTGVDGMTFTTDITSAKDAVLDETYDAAYVMTSLDTYTVIKKDSRFDFNEDFFEDVLRSALINKKLIENDIDPNVVADAQYVEFNVDYDVLGKDATQGLLFGFVALFGLYFLILMYGQLVATSVAREKDSRTMELLITSTNPKTLIIGKVLAAGLAGFIQVVLIGLVTYIGFSLNQSYYPEMIMDMLLGGASVDVMVIYAVFSFTGYLLYLFIYAALGSLVSKVEDVASAVSSVTVVFVIAYLIATTAMSSPDTTLVKISSYVPFVSLFTMPIRYMMTSVPTLQIVISLVLMIGVTVLIAYISIYIYRMGSLNYGNRMKLFKVLKTAFKKEA